MRVHFSSIVLIFTALLLVSGTVGCQSNGGAWYNPKSYSWTNPFSKENAAPPYSPNALANKPSLDAQPNINTPQGGYTDKALTANRTGSPGGTASASPPEHWSQQSSMGSQGTPNPYSNYTVPEPSQYLPYAGAYDGQGAAASPYQYAQQNPSPYQYSPETAQRSNSMPYGGDYSVPAGYQPTANHVPVDNFSVNPAAGNYTVGNYPPLGGAHPNDPYIAGVQQPQQSGAVQPTGFGVYNQPASGSYQSEGVSTASPYQPYPPPAAGGGYNYNY
jgi:hypothetical protein